MRVAQQQRHQVVAPAIGQVAQQQVGDAAEMKDQQADDRRAGQGEGIVHPLAGGPGYPATQAGRHETRQVAETRIEQIGESHRRRGTPAAGTARC